MSWDTLQLALTRRFVGGFFAQASFDYQWRDELRSANLETGFRSNRFSQLDDVAPHRLTGLGGDVDDSHVHADGALASSAARRGRLVISDTLDEHDVASR